MRQQRAAAIELAPVDDKPIADLCDARAEFTRVFAPRFGKGVAQAHATERLGKEETLLLFIATEANHVEHRKMVLRNLANRWIGSRNYLDHLGQRDIGDLRAAVSARHVDSPQPALRKPVQLIERQAAFAVANRRLTREFLREPMRDVDRFAVVAN